MALKGFQTRSITVPGPSGPLEIVVDVAGQGPPLLLIHGYPQTRACWHAVAPALTDRFTVVAPDLRGYGESGKPPGDAGHVTYSKRAMAADMVHLMAALGFDRFAVAGHDRGGRVAYRLASDHPDRVSHLAVLDIAPTGYTFAQTSKRFALGTYHWFFLAQPHDLPERMIGSDPDFFLGWTLRSWAGDGFAFDPAAMESYLTAFRDPATIHATCEDYRAGAGIDCEIDAETIEAGQKITCPILILWGGDRKGDGRAFDYLGIWRKYADDVRGEALPCGHFLPEEQPARVVAAFRDFFAA